MTKKITASAETENNDLIASGLVSLVKWGKQHKQSLLTALCILVVSVIIGYTYHAHQKSVTEKSWAAFYNAQIAFSAQGQEAGFAKLDGISADFPGTPAAQYHL